LNGLVAPDGTSIQSVLGGADAASIVTGAPVGVSLIELGTKPDRIQVLRELTERAAVTDSWTVLSASEQEDGADPLEIAWLFRSEPGAIRRRGVGGALSHLAAWRRIAGHHEGALELVLEDTAIPTEDFAAELSAVVAALRDAGTSFDLALLGYRTPATAHAPEPNPNAGSTNPNADSTELRPMRWERYLGGTFAYVVSTTGAKALLDMVQNHGLPASLERLLMLRGPELGVLECDPPLADAGETPAVTGSRARPGRRADRGAVSIYIGRGWVTWHPVDIVTRGLGGSETASYRLAGALSQQGYAVTLYGDFAQEVVGGVQLRDWETFDPDEPRRALISSRNPELFDKAMPGAERSLLWAHDADFEDRLTPERATGIDAVVCLSAWHRGHMAERYPWIADKLVTVRNGITPGYFTRQPAPARSRRVLFSSSPDRGLDVLLELWPLVREQVPDAELVYTYAPVYDEVAGHYPPLSAHRDTILTLAAQPGVRRLDGLSQPALARLMRSSLVWAHPSYTTPYAGRFHETSCIGAMEAQAAGCCVVAADWGALRETVRTGTLIGGDPTKADFKERFAAAIVAGLTDPELQRTAQSEGPRTVLPWDWNGVAEMVAREIEALVPAR
jgi:hypothetical protein